MRLSSWSDTAEDTFCDLEGNSKLLYTSPSHSYS